MSEHPICSVSASETLSPVEKAPTVEIVSPAEPPVLRVTQATITRWSRFHNVFNDHTANLPPAELRFFANRIRRCAAQLEQSAEDVAAKGAA